jgi:succinoglycan biosynthesis transport protein ExoP
MNGIPPIRPILKRNFGGALFAFISAIGVSLLYLKLTPPLYSGSTRLILDDRRLSLSELGQAIASNPVPGNANPIATQAELIKSERILERAGVLLSKELPPQKVPSTQEMAGPLKVKIVPATNILELTYDNSDPKLVAAVLNAVSKAMVQESEESIRQQASSVRQFIEARLPQQQQNLNKADLQLSEFKEANELFSPDAQNKSLVDSLATVEDQTRTLTAQLREAQSKSQQLQQVVGSSDIQSAYQEARVGQDEELKVLRTKLTELNAQVAEARSRFKDDHPRLQELLSARDKMRQLYNRSLARIVPDPSSFSASNVAADDLSRGLTSNYIVGEVDQNALRNKLNALKNQEQPLRDRLGQLPTKQRILATLTRRREQEEATLKLLQNKLEEARIAEAQLVSNIRIVGLAAPPDSPTSPKSRVVLLLGTAAGLVAAVGMIVLGEMLNDKVGSASEIESQLKLSVLGTLTDRLPGQIDHFERFLDNPGAVEPYRRLLKALELSTQEQLKSIVVTSSVAGEGKSNVSAHLAAVSAVFYRKTLLIDADLDHPLQDQFFKILDQPGLTDVLKGDASLLSAVQSTDIPDLDILSHGQWLNYSAQVFEAKAMKALIKTAMEHYDLVIVDASPISHSIDAVTLGEYTDGIMLVVRPEFTVKATVHQVVSDLQKSGSSVLGAVVNTTPDPTQNKYLKRLSKIDLINKGFLTRKSLQSSI